MRLIDADKLNINDMCDHCRSACCGDCIGNDDFVKWIESQPTAYDVKSVVEQLEEKVIDCKEAFKDAMDDRSRDECIAIRSLRGGFEEAIEIVKGETK